MDNNKEELSSGISNVSTIDSPIGTKKHTKNHESHIHHHHSGLKFEEKLRTLIHKHSEPNHPTHTPVVEPLKPMRYIRHFTVPVSLKRSQLLSHHNPNIKQRSIGKKQFNENPKEGIRWLIENKLIENTSENIAAFLFNETGLSKRAIGDYLGEKDDFNIEVLKHFAHMYDFISTDIVDALRRYLFTFVLPGEAQKIDRIMEAFAQRYYECNPDIYANSEVCFILSFAIIMLNTSLHNKNARSSGTFTYEKFIHSLHEAIPRQSMPDLYRIKNIYDTIKNNEFKFPDEDIDLSNINARIKEGNSTIIKEGWLWKQGGRVRNWKRRWFVITDGCLFYYESRTKDFNDPLKPKQEIDNLRGMIPLIDIGVREIEDDRTKQFCFELFPLAGEKLKTSKPIAGETGKTTEGHHTVYRMSASSEDERKDWIRTLRIGSQNQLPKQRSS